MPPSVVLNVSQAMEQAMNQGKQGGGAAAPGANPFAGMNGGGGMPPGFGFPPMPPSGFSSPPSGGQTVDTTAKAVGQSSLPLLSTVLSLRQCLPCLSETLTTAFHQLSALAVSKMFVKGPCKPGIQVLRAYTGGSPPPSIVA